MSLCSRWQLQGNGGGGGGFYGGFASGYTTGAYTNGGGAGGSGYIETPFKRKDYVLLQLY